MPLENTIESQWHMQPLLASIASPPASTEYAHTKTQWFRGESVWFVHLSKRVQRGLMRPPLSSHDSSFATEKEYSLIIMATAFALIAPCLGRLGRRRYQFPIRETCSSYVFDQFLEKLELTDPKLDAFYHFSIFMRPDDGPTSLVLDNSG